MAFGVRIIHFFNLKKKPKVFLYGVYNIPWKGIILFVWMTVYIRKLKNWTPPIKRRPC